MYIRFNTDKENYNKVIFTTILTVIYSDLHDTKFLFKKEGLPISIFYLIKP